MLIDDSGLHTSELTINKTDSLETDLMHQKISPLLQQICYDKYGIIQNLFLVYNFQYDVHNYWKYLDCHEYG